jgi:hypothetical protein
MALHSDVDTVLTESVAGRDFDMWIDWNGAASASVPAVAVVVANGKGIAKKPVDFPISPSSSEGHFPTVKFRFLVATSAPDIPSLSHSPSSPETPASVDLTLSVFRLANCSQPNRRLIKKRKRYSRDAPSTPYQHDDSNSAANKRPHNIIERNIEQISTRR